MQHESFFKKKKTTKILYFQSVLKSVFPNSSLSLPDLQRKNPELFKKIKYMALCELDGFFHDKIPWHMPPLILGISITFYYINDPFSLQSSYKMTSSMHILCIYDVSANVGIYNYMENDLF